MRGLLPHRCRGSAPPPPPPAHRVQVQHHPGFMALYVCVQWLQILRLQVADQPERRVVPISMPFNLAGHLPCLFLVICDVMTVDGRSNCIGRPRVVQTCVSTCFAPLCVHSRAWYTWSCESVAEAPLLAQDRRRNMQESSALPPVFLRDTQRYVARQEMRPLPADQRLPSPKTARRRRPLSR